MSDSVGGICRTVADRDYHERPRRKAFRSQRITAHSRGSAQLLENPHSAPCSRGNCVWPMDDGRASEARVRYQPRNAVSTAAPHGESRLAATRQQKQRKHPQPQRIPANEVGGRGFGSDSGAVERVVSRGTGGEKGRRQAFADSASETPQPTRSLAGRRPPTSRRFLIWRDWLGSLAYRSRFSSAAVEPKPRMNALLSVTADLDDENLEELRCTRSSERRVSARRAGSRSGRRHVRRWASSTCHVRFFHELWQAFQQCWQEISITLSTYTPAGVLACVRKRSPVTIELQPAPFRSANVGGV